MCCMVKVVVQVTRSQLLEHHNKKNVFNENILNLMFEEDAWRFTLT